MCIRTLAVLVLLSFSGCSRLANFPDKHPPEDSDADTAEDPVTDSTLDTSGDIPGDTSEDTFDAPDLPEDTSGDSEMDPVEDTEDEEVVETCILDPAPIGADINVSNDTYTSQDPSIVWTGSQFGVAWQGDPDSNWDIFFAQLDPEGGPIGSTWPVTEQSSISQSPSVVWADGRFAFVWNDNGDGDYDIYYSAFNAAGAWLTSQYGLTSTTGHHQYDPAMVWSGSHLAVGWYDDRNATDEIYFTIFTWDGTLVASQVRVTDVASDKNRVDVAWSGSEYGLAWTDDRDGNFEVYFQSMNSTGTVIGSNTRITDATGYSGQPSIAWTGSVYWVAWVDDRDANSEIYMAEIAPPATKLSTDIRFTEDAAESGTPSIVWTGSVLGLAWQDMRDGNREIYFSMLDETGLVMFSDIRITDALDDSEKPVLAWSGSTFGIAWQDMRDGNREIYFNVIDPCQ